MKNRPRKLFQNFWPPLGPTGSLTPYRPLRLGSRPAPHNWYTEQTTAKVIRIVFNISVGAEKKIDLFDLNEGIELTFRPSRTGFYIMKLFP